MGDVIASHDFWYNFVTGEYDYREAPTTDKEAVQYIPQLGGVGLYQIFRERDSLTIIEAMAKVLEIAAGEDETSREG